MARGNGRRRHVRGRGTVYEESDPRRKTRWVAERYVRLPDGRRKRVRVRAQTVEDALDLLEKRVAEARVALPEGQRLTLEEYLERWLEHKSHTVRASTLHHYRQDVELHINPALGGVRLSRLLSYEVQELLSAIQAKGHRSMAARVRGTLKQALGQAVKWELIPRNPVDALDPIDRGRPQRGHWTREQMNAFLREAEGSPYFLVFVLALTTGLRKGEIVALEWGDVRGDRVRVRRTVSLKAEGGTADPKSTAGRRFVPIAPEIVELVRSHRGEAADGDPIFPGRGKRRSRLTHVRTVSREAADLMDRAGVPHIRFHDMRRTYATMLAADGVHPRVIQKLLGHSTMNLAMEVYTEVLEEQERAAVIRLGGGTFGGSPSEPEDTRVNSSEDNGGEK